MQLLKHVKFTNFLPRAVVERRDMARDSWEKLHSLAISPPRGFSRLLPYGRPRNLFFFMPLVFLLAC